DHARQQSRELLNHLLDDVKGPKSEAEQGKTSPPALYLVLVPAGDYYSPLSPRLRGPQADAAAWRKTFQELFGNNKLEKSGLTIAESQAGAAKTDIMAEVDKAIAGTTKDDVIVF